MGEGTERTNGGSTREKIKGGKEERLELKNSFQSRAGALMIVTDRRKILNNASSLRGTIPIKKDYWTQEQ